MDTLITNVLNPMKKDFVSIQDSVNGTSLGSKGENYVYDPWANKESIFEIPPTLLNDYFTLSDKFLQNPNYRKNELKDVIGEINKLNDMCLDYYGLKDWSNVEKGSDAESFKDFFKGIDKITTNSSKISNRVDKYHSKFKNNAKKLVNANKQKKDLENELDKINI
jgi:hypothetical protein